MGVPFTSPTTPPMVSDCPEDVPRGGRRRRRYRRGLGARVVGRQLGGAQAGGGDVLLNGSAQRLHTRPVRRHRRARWRFVPRAVFVQGAGLVTTGERIGGDVIYRARPRR